ncbi:Sterol O-acyltransferase 1 [Pseudolycoriella hygida]|uniref:O-acyltransferase n=1 Tax=Pseudolycoriella hygida TaxID=35572 RepID=A0A9Q0N8D8_9DIPT|nr:Sterol O-acyltransferase 1 [Pseudolycoriella hygida]
MNGIVEQNGSGAIEKSGEPKNSTSSVMHEMIMHKLRKRIETLQGNIVKDVDNKLDAFVDELVNELNRFNVQDSELISLFKKQNGKHSNSVNRLPTSDRNYLPEKEFAARNSLLNDLFEIKHIKTIYHIFIAILFILWLNTLVHDYVADGTINFGLTPIKTGFGKIHLAFFIWCMLQAVSCLIYLGFSTWATIVNKSSKDRERRINKVMLSAFVITQISILYSTCHLVLYFDLPPASSLTILLEMIRFVMKNHAFVRSNTPRVLAGLEKSENRKVGKCLVPSFHTFIYFMFAPTLVYRDHYPRTKYIRWSRVAWNLFEVVGVIFYLSFIFERFLFPYFRNFGITSIEPKHIVLSIFGSMLPGTITFLCGFYCLLHAWMNATAELLKFADRMFYKDWWNSSSFDVFFRTWNIVVHDFLYTYIYKDMYEIVYKQSKVMSALVVFTVSAVFHELILAVAFRFFYPVLFVLFQGFGFHLMFIKNKSHISFGNTFLWIAMAIGNGLCVSLYCMEYFARQNCNMRHDSIWEYYVPISWSCNGILSNGSSVPSFDNHIKLEL